MKDYLYDGSFEGALTGIYQMFNDRVKTGEARLVSTSTYQRDCFTVVTEVETDPSKAEKVTKWLLEEFGEIGFRRAAYAYLSDDEQYGTYLFCFLKKMNRLGEKGLDFFADQDINKIYKIYNRVCRESHLLLGLIRFVELQSGILYATFEPTANILTLMTGHFKERLSNQIWVIHDTKRKMAAFYDGKEVYIRPLDGLEDLKLSSSEKAYQDMWKTYFKRIAIEHRNNPRQQMHMMPKKYWKFLVERPQEKFK